MLPLVWGLDGLVAIIQKTLKSSSPLRLDSDVAYHQMEVAWQPGTGYTCHGSAPLSWWFGEALGCISHRPTYCPSPFLSCCFSSSALIFLLFLITYIAFVFYLFTLSFLYIFLPWFQSMFFGILTPYTFSFLTSPHGILSLSFSFPIIFFHFLFSLLVLLLFSNILYENVQIYVQCRKNFT